MQLEAVNAALEKIGSDAESPFAGPLVAAIRRVAALLDHDDGNAPLWREYRMMLKDLREVLTDGGGSDLDDLLEELRASPMGDTPES